MPLEHRRRRQHIPQGGIGAGANTDLIDLYIGKLPYRADIIRHMRAGRQRLKAVEVDHYHPLIFRVRVRGDWQIILFSALSL